MKRGPIAIEQMTYIAELQLKRRLRPSVRRWRQRRGVPPKAPTAWNGSLSRRRTGKDALETMQTDRDELIPTRWSLIQRLKNWDDDESWREFFDTYWRLIYGTAIKSGLNHQQAEEAVQETVVTVCKKMPDFNADPAAGSFKGWLMRITRRRITDQLRKAGRENARRYLSASPRAEGGERRTPTEERVPDPAGNALERIWDEDWDRNMIDAGLDRLKQNVRPEHFQVYYLVAIKERRLEAVAKLHGITVAQVSVIKHRLGQRLTRIIKALQDRFERDPATGLQG